MDEAPKSTTRTSGGILLVVMTIALALLAAMMLTFLWIDVYHRIEHHGRPFDLCKAIASLTHTHQSDDSAHHCPYR